MDYNRGRRTIVTAADVDPCEVGQSIVNSDSIRAIVVASDCDHFSAGFADADEG
jgi:hypothetical protein